MSGFSLHDEAQSEEMDFFRFGDCIIANVSLQEYYSKHGPTIALLFMDDLPRLPLVGFSIMSAKAIVEHNLKINSLIFYNDWHTWQNDRIIEWADKPVSKFDVLRILLRIDTNGISVRYRLNAYLTTCERSFDFPPGFQNVYMAIAGDYIFKPNCDYCNISIVNAQQLMQWMMAEKSKQLALQRQRALLSSSPEKSSVSQIVTTTKAKSMQRVIPKCLLCFENDVEMLLLPCGHALCCKKCSDDWISHTITAVNLAILNKQQQQLTCPVCRCNVTAFGRIWFTSNSCCLCGCTEMTAVAGGKGGCGCVVGCFKEAKKKLKEGDLCPACGKRIIRIIQAYIQCDGDAELGFSSC